MPNNREWALFIWLAIIVLAIVLTKTGRSGVSSVLRAGATSKILVPLIMMFGYVAAELWLGYKLALWRTDLTTDIIFWSVAAMALFFNFVEAPKHPHYFRNRIAASVGVPELLQFWTNLFVLGLIAELFIQPLVAILAMLGAVAASDNKYRSINRLMQWLLAMVGFALFAFAIQQLITNSDEINWASVVRKFTLPIWLTIGLLPFIYMLSLYSGYEIAFMRINFFTDDRRARWRAKLALILKFHLKSHELHAFTGPWQQKIAAAPSFAAARAVVDDFRQSRKDAARAAAEEQQRIERYTGSDETDAQGRRLDRREFRETTGALRWLAICQMGWYQHEDRGGQYRADLLEVFADDLTRQGLPPESGISLTVSEDGQAWYAWRRTVTGWCFAIGAAGPPPDQWEYDGAEPPSGFPGNDPRWGTRAFSNEVSRNW